MLPNLMLPFQGFQLVFSSSHGREQGSLFSLHQALTELEESIEKKKKKRRHGSIVVKMGLGRLFQKIELSYPSIHVSIYRLK